MNRRPRSGDREAGPPLAIQDRRRIDPVPLRPRDPDRPAITPAVPAPSLTPAVPAPSLPGTGPDRTAPSREGVPTTSERGQREPDAAGEDGPGDRVRLLEAQAAEHLADLQRVKAEYDNYRKRVRRDRLAVREAAVANVLSGLLPVLDAIDQARAHGEVEGGFRAVAELLEHCLAALGLRSVGEAGRPFDPRLHEAATATPSATGALCAEVLRPGYRVGEHLLRPAQVRLTDPPAPLPPTAL
ncbi:nucleotide exchange factor GrpE [Streptomyces sp. NRRL S-350]|uniref:nucleotide exchange factor GrpE n=1 Tax=Streptomyces sp. NRRL S-350 TaxID=1463902 RepID=UPI0007C59303|nr:nucleotide exchange factor GrpE [Streptomyces sp. NRRL S-350]